MLLDTWPQPTQLHLQFYNIIFVYTMTQKIVSKDLLGNYGAMSNPIWSNIEIVFWVWYLIIGSYQLLNHQIYYENIITNLMASLMLINNYKSTTFNHNSCHGLILLFPHPFLAIWPKSINFVSSDQITFFQFFTVHSLYFRAKPSVVSDGW